MMMMDYEKLTANMQLPTLARTCFCCAETSGGSSICNSPASLKYNNTTAAATCSSPRNVAKSSQQSLHGMFSPFFLDGESSPLLSASCAKSSEGCFFPCMDALSTIKRFGVLSADFAPESKFDQTYGRYTSNYAEGALLKDAPRCAQFNFSPVTSEITFPLVDAVACNEIQDAFCKLNLNLVSNSSNRKLTENFEFSPQNSEKLTISQQSTAENARKSTDKQQQSQRTEASLSSSKKLSKSTDSTVANMVLSQRPLQVRSSYYGEYQRTVFDDSYTNYQPFGARQHLSQFQNTPQFNSFNGNNKACYNNSFAKYARNYQFEPKNGMRDVPLWLKSLRLHKYTPLLASMGYDEMMKLDEDRLEYLGVTKGARRKIMQSIEKLRERPSLLRTMEKAVDEGGDYGNLAGLIAELRGTMNTPIRGYPPPGYIKKNLTRSQIEGFDVPAEKLDEENLPGHLIRIVGKVQAILTGPNAPSLNEDCYAWLMQTFDRIAVHEAFTPAQRVRAATWKKSFKKVCSPSVTRRNMRKPNASVLLSSGSGNNSQGNLNGLQGSQSATDVQRKRSDPNQNRKTSQTGFQPPTVQLVQQQRQLQTAAPVISQTIFQDALNSLVRAFSTNAPISQQTAAYCLGVASVTAALSSPDMVETISEMVSNSVYMSKGNASQQALNQLQHDAATRILKQTACSTIPYGPLGCFVQQEYNRNGLNLDAYNTRNLNNANRRSAWSPYTSTEEQHSQAVSPGIQSFSEAPCPGYQPNVSFSSPNISSISGVQTASTSAFSPTRNTAAQNSNAAYAVSNRSCNQNLNVTASSKLSHSNSDRGQYKQSSHSLFTDLSLRPDVLEARPSISSNREDLMPSAWYNVPPSSSLKISPTESLFESISGLGAEHSNLRMAEPRKQTKKLCNDETSLFGAALPTRPAAGSPSEQLNSMSPSPRCSPNASERGSGAGSPPGLLVYNFVNEGSSGLDSACRNAALEENH